MPSGNLRRTGPLTLTLSLTYLFLFVLLFPDGGNGWRPGMKCVDEETKLTLRKYSVYLLRERQNGTNAIMSAHKLMQQYAVMAFARDQAQTLKYHRQKE